MCIVLLKHVYFMVVQLDNIDIVIIHRGCQGNILHAVCDHGQSQSQEKS